MSAITSRFINLSNVPNMKFRMHMAQVVLVLLAIVISIARLANKNTIPSRASVWYLVVCFKSLIIILYQVLSEHHDRFRKWASPKANAVLNVIETIFWLAAFIISIAGNSGTCKGSSCALGSFLSALAFFLFLITGFVAFMSVRDYRYLRRNGMLPGSAPAVKRDPILGEV
ncbi:hypothetical protein PVAG01_09303 [Phlyctema vagabunda]|uniref:MARVEL domain-containing protein n=1 Tax=Phlyctema vagabunda TaxID=108571 RepID=A0ABR4P747_9HELO